MLADLGASSPGVTLHHLHLWQNGPGQLLLTAHVVVDAHLDATAIEALFARLKAHLHARWNVTHATLEPEVECCGMDSLLGSWERVETPQRPEV